MRLRAPLLIGLTLVPHLAAAQIRPADNGPTRDDGIRAVARGDYTEAVRVLRPLAEDAEPPDPVAQFFMAFLYNAGAGVKADGWHACSLFLNAAATDNPFADTAARLARLFQEKIPGPFCRREWGAQPPATFELAPNYRVVMTSAGTTVFFNGHERSTSAPDGNPFFVYAPPVYTAVDIKKPVTARRYFIQSFVWWPNAAPDPTSWSLTWSLSEVAGLDYVTLATETGVLTVEAPTQPSTVDVSKLVAISTNASGEAEWRIGAGSQARGGVIPWWQEP